MALSEDIIYEIVVFIGMSSGFRYIPPFSPYMKDTETLGIF